MFCFSVNCCQNVEFTFAMKPKCPCHDIFFKENTSGGTSHRNYFQAMFSIAFGFCCSKRCVLYIFLHLSSGLLSKHRLFKKIVMFNMENFVGKVKTCKTYTRKTYRVSHQNIPRNFRFILGAYLLGTEPNFVGLVIRVLPNCDSMLTFYSLLAISLRYSIQYSELNFWFSHSNPWESEAEIIFMKEKSLALHSSALKYVKSPRLYLADFEHTEISIFVWSNTTQLVRFSAEAVLALDKSILWIYFYMQNLIGNINLVLYVLTMP